MNILKKTNNTMDSKGFTLIELLVVIAIIALLASATLSSLGTSRTRGEIAKVIGDYRSVANSIELYRQANSSQYPGTAGSPVSVSSLVSGVLSTYIKQNPSVSSLVVSGGSVLYYLNSSTAPRYWCDNTSNNQDYVIYFTPTAQSAGSELFKQLYSAPGTPVVGLVCIPVFQL